MKTNIDHFKELETIAVSLSNELDISSKNINTLEKRLQNLNTNIPFEMCAYKYESEVKKIDKKHENCNLKNFYPSNGYSTENSWYLSWDISEISKTFRLMVVEIEIDYGYSQDNKSKIVLKKDINFKKPLIECKTEIRLKFAKFITPFIIHFTEYLKNINEKLKLN